MLGIPDYPTTAGDKVTFSFNKECVHTADSGKYAACVVPTNLANWGRNDIVGNLTGINVGAGEIGIYFTRVNPYVGALPADGVLDLSLVERAALIETLEAQKIWHIPGSQALLGTTTDWVAFADMNWVTIVTKGATTDLNVYVAMIEQSLPAVIP